jgi:hypothetical protein
VLLPGVCAVVAMCGAAVAGGCGDDSDSDAKDTVTFAAADEPPEAFVKRLTKLLETTTATRECAELTAINSRSVTRFPCPPPKTLRNSMKSFEVVGAEDYGSGGVVDYKSGQVKDGASILLFVGVDRSWALSRFGVVAGKTVGTSDEKSRDGYEGAVDGYLEAIRTRDCDAYFDLTYNDSAPKKAVCKQAFPTTKALAKRLKADPAAKPKYEGGNASFGFYSLETQKPKPQNMTISIAKATGKSAQPYVILDVTPSPTAADQKKVLREFQEQRQEKLRERQEQEQKRKQQQKDAQA